MRLPKDAPSGRQCEVDWIRTNDGRSNRFTVYRFNHSATTSCHPESSVIRDGNRTHTQRMDGILSPTRLPNSATRIYTHPY